MLGLTRLMSARLWGAMVILCSLGATSAFAQDEINSGDTAWILTSTAIVIMMTAPGLAFFYGGLVNNRNVLSTLMHSFFALCLVSIQWVLWGYSFSFGSGAVNVTQDIALFGGFDYIGLSGLGATASGTVPDLAFVMFQGAFAIITVALISGAYAERMSFAAFVVFSLLWTTIVYNPLCYWVWGGGWLGEMGALDFAGGTVVHISSGVSALVAALVIGKRLGYPKMTAPPHNIPFTLLGAALLWVGWFGFNAGSALAADSTAALAFINTNTAAAAAGLAWAIVEWIARGKPTLLGCATGAVAGLVGITPAAGFVEVMHAIVIGAGAGIISYIGVNTLKPMLGYDDSLDVFGVHGLAGTWGALATGVFATVDISMMEQVWIQLIGIVAAAIWAGLWTLILLFVVGVVFPLRVDEDEETKGLDISLHGEVGYNELKLG